MTVVLVLAVWFGLSWLTWALFAVVVRGGGGGDGAPELRPQGDVPRAG